MSGALGDAGADGDWVLVAVPPAAAAGVQSAANSQLPDDATVATAATAATVPSHEEAVARGQMMAATAPSVDGVLHAAPPGVEAPLEAAVTVRPFDRLPDNELAKVLAVLKQSENRRVESVCQRWRQIRPRASLARVKSLKLDGTVVTLVARRFRNGQEDYYSTNVRYSNIGIGRKEMLILDGTGDDFIISTLHDDGRQLFLRMHPGTGVCKPPNHHVLTEDRTQATHFEAVETLRQGPREYYTLPDYVYFRLKGTSSFLKVHAWEQIGVLPQGCVTNGRRKRPNEGHAFKMPGP
jgi:hypothetical protein